MFRISYHDSIFIVEVPWPTRAPEFCDLWQKTCLRSRRVAYLGRYQFFLVPSIIICQVKQRTTNSLPTAPPLSKSTSSTGTTTPQFCLCKHDPRGQKASNTRHFFHDMPGKTSSTHLNVSSTAITTLNTLYRYNIPQYPSQWSADCGYLRVQDKPRSHFSLSLICLFQTVVRCSCVGFLSTSPITKVVFSLYQVGFESTT